MLGPRETARPAKAAVVSALDLSRNGCISSLSTQRSACRPARTHRTLTSLQREAMVPTTGRSARTRKLSEERWVCVSQGNTTGPATIMAKPMCNLTGHSDRLTAHPFSAPCNADRAAAPVAYTDIAPQLGCPCHTPNRAMTEREILPSKDQNNCLSRKFRARLSTSKQTSEPLLP
jgi:hypothetical protein